MLDDYASLQLRFWFNDNLNKVLYADSKDRCLWQRLLISLWNCIIVAISVGVPSLLTFLLLHTVTSSHYNPWRTRETFRRSFSLRRWEGHATLICSICWVLLLHRILPGQRYEGPPANSGLRPSYKRNGFAFFVLSTAFAALCAFVCGSRMLHMLPALVSSAAVFSLAASIAAYGKGRFAPNSPESADFSSNWLTDLFYGVELYPRCGELQLKQALVRTGAVIDLLVLFVGSLNNSTGGGVPAAVTLVVFGVSLLHRARKYWHEECYSHAFEATGHKLGLLQCLRHLLLRPFLLNVGVLSIGSKVARPTSLTALHWFSLLVIFLLAASAVVLTYLVDRQKFLVKSKRGKCHTWGRLAGTINAFYVDSHDIRRSSTILCSGYWGLARHLNYTLEMLTHGLLAFPGLFLLGDPLSLVPFVYTSAVLTFRTREDFRKCRRKYGPYWSLYCERVPHTFIPGLV